VAHILFSVWSTPRNTHDSHCESLSFRLGYHFCERCCYERVLEREGISCTENAICLEKIRTSISMRKSQNLDSNRFISSGWTLEKSLPRKRGETVAQLLREWWSHHPWRCSTALEMWHWGTWSMGW